MANNYSQPFYGFPHGFPPPQMHPPQSAPPEEQSGAPPLQQLPGINLTPYAQNNQQPPFPAPAWPPHLPPDPNIWALFQNGTFPPPNLPPPPFPGMAFPPPSLPQTPQNPTMPPHFPPPFPHRPAQASAPPPAPAPAAALPPAPVPANERIQEIMHSDREDGELSESDGGPHPPPPVKVNGGPPPTSAVQHHGHSNNAIPQKQESHTSFMEKLQQDRESARQFIKLLHSNNIPYRTLADEKLDAELLRGLYQSVNLPSEPAPILPPKPNSTASSAPAVTSPQHNTTPALKTGSIPAPSTKSIASPTAPGDRKDYIARLQAAKAAKQAGSSKPMSPAQHPLPAKPNTPQPATTPTTKPPVTDEQRARNTELIKQRLEAIKAKQKAPNGVSNGAVQPSTPSRGEQTQTTQPAPNSVTTPTTQNFTPSFSGIPGLFMSNTPASSTAPAVSQKPSTAKAEVSASRESTTSYTRPLGQSAHAHQEDDSMIIEVSDDESNGSDMDIEDDQPAPQTIQTPRRNLPHLARYAGSAAPATPADSTSGAQTPSTLAREKELVDKEKQLVAMRETLKKKLAEKRERDRLASAAAASSPSVQKPSTPVLRPQSQTPSKLPTPMMESSSVSPRPADTTRFGTPGGKGTTQSRRAEIQSKLPTLDAEIASNTSRMAELTKELEKLTALNNKIARDKEQLTKELESLGVDTEGMSHAQLRAKKDEIEREQSPAPNASSESADHAPQSSGIVPRAVQPSLQNSNERGNTKTDLPGLRPTSNQLPQGHVTLPGLGHITPQSATNYVSTSNVNGTIHTNSSQGTQPPSGMGGVTKDGTEAANTESPANTSDRDMDEDFYSPPPPVEKDSVVPPAAPNAEVNGAQPATAPSPSEGEVEMSVSEGEDVEDEEEEYEPEYDPEEHAVVENKPAEQAQKAQPEVAPSASTSHVSAEEEEAYEPPNADQDMADVQNEGVATLDSGPQADQAEPEDGAMDIATSSDESSDSSDDSDSDEESDSGSEVENTISGHNFPHQDTNVADDLAPELQSRATEVVTVKPVPEVEEQDEQIAFKPYQSPLRMFKSYRYHPHYTQEVPGGFLSLTYSHQIDPMKPFCQYESAGGACNDPECPDQHFRDATITGDKLLVQLGTANPGKTSEEKQRWNDGLRGVLKELRQKNIKDPNGIAEEIARYRRQFLNDDTRVVNL